MPEKIWNVEWLNANSQRRYPLTAESSGVAESGTFELPTDFIVGLDIPINSGLNVDAARFFVKHVGAYATGYGITVGYQPAVGDAVNVGTALVGRDTHTRNDTYALGGVGDYVDTVGKITIGNLDNIGEQPDGFFTFAIDTARIEPDCVRPIIRGVTSLSVVSGIEQSAKLYGDIELVADDNIQLVPVIVSGEDPVIRISAIKGEGLIEECDCDDAEDSPPIRRINGIPPTSGGDFTLLGNSCLQIEAIDNGLKLLDSCSEPCCGCEELEAVTRDLEAFGSKATTLENFLVRLESSVTQMDMVVLGSKLNDQGCIECG